MNKRANVAPGLLGKRFEFMKCPNAALSEKRGEIVGSYIEDGKLHVCLLFEDGKTLATDADFVEVRWSS